MAVPRRRRRVAFQAISETERKPFASSTFPCGNSLLIAFSMTLSINVPSSRQKQPQASIQLPHDSYVIIFRADSELRRVEVLKNVTLADPTTQAVCASFRGSPGEI